MDNSRPKIIDNVDKLKTIFLERHKLPKFQEEIENLNKPIPSKEMELVGKKLHIKKNPDPDASIGDFYQNFKEEL